MTKIFIGILQYNKWLVTKKCIESILSNTSNMDYGIFILDNASIDGSHDEIANMFKDNKSVHIIKHDHNSGVIGGRNMLFDWFLKEILFTDIIFLDNDQFVKQNWDEGYIKIREKHKNSIIGIESWLLGSNLAPVRKCTNKDKYFTYVGCGGMMIPREVVEKIGVFDVLFSPAYFEDPDYCLRAKENGIDVICNHISSIDHLAHQTLGMQSLRAKDSFRKSLMNFKKKWNSTYKGGYVFENKDI